ncbi:hypothetical protein [Paenibacillus shenyangensis]|uniref:hypothetical protein n=1 Tax=Paenibacillus sp. A9 TaxID=1284352 RepID=UPI000366F0DC|nr:hypothetical protein [Paenibacillus sp. A9]
MKIRRTSGDNPLIITTSFGPVEFNEKGIAEVNDEVGELLLTIPGYEEVKTRGGNKENSNVPPATTPNETETKSNEDNQPPADAASDQKKEATTASKPADATTKKTAESK